MMVPVVVRPRPIWQLNTYTSPFVGSWDCSSPMSWSKSFGSGGFSSVIGTRAYFTGRPSLCSAAYTYTA